VTRQPSWSCTSGTANQFFVCALLGSVESAEDVPHDCFLSLVRKPENFSSERASLKTYLYAAARNLALKYFRDQGRYTGLDEIVEEPKDSARRAPLRRLLDEELSAHVREAVFSLPPLQPESLILFEYEGLRLNEVAEIAGTDVGAVKARLYRAREGLRRILRPYLESNQNRIVVGKLLL
jgi:RNA polymerase sigma-70 factor, ECF subfamily